MSRQIDAQIKVHGVILAVGQGRGRRIACPCRYQSRLLIVKTIQMPHAYCLESRCLKGVTRLADRDFSKSSEWFVLGDGFTLDDVAQAMLDAARRLRREARWKLVWPSQGRVAVFDSGWRKDGKYPSKKYDLA